MDACLTLPSGNSYLFDGASYGRWNVDGVCDASGVSVAENWRGLWGDRVDAGVYWGFGKAYFFRDGEFTRYDLDRDEADYVRPIAEGWQGLPASGIDAAVNWLNGKIYIFSGPNYWRWDIPLDRLDPDYPRAIAGAWNGLWPEGVDAGFYPGGRHAYFIRGQVVRTYDVLTDQVVAEGALAHLRLEALPVGLVAPTRGLSREQAAQLAIYLANEGRFSFKDAWTALRRGPDGKILSLDPTRNVTLEPARVGAVDLVNVIAPASTVCDNLDPRMLVALEKLSRWINAGTANVSAIRHLGIGHGQGASNDCHNQGRALDLAGLSGDWEGTAFTRMVKADWGLQPETTSGFRIDPAADPIGHDLFRRAYGFGTYECECRTGNAWPPTEIGDGGFVICPDYVADTPANQKLRRDHNDHIHMQVGPTHG
jgi:Hemopexin